MKKNELNTTEVEIDIPLKVVIALIAYHYSNMTKEFDSQSIKIAEECFKKGKPDLGHYINGLAGRETTFVPM